jgi:PsbP
LQYKKILLSGIFISIFTLIIFLNSQAEVKGSSDFIQSPQKREGFLLYNNTDYGFQLLYPQNWNVIEGDTTPGDYVTDVVMFEPFGEMGKHFTKKTPVGEVGLLIGIDNLPENQGYNLQQYADATYNTGEDTKGIKLFDYNSLAKLGDTKAFEIKYEKKEGKNREYLSRILATTYGENNFFNLIFRSRDKYSDQMIPLGNTMIDSFRFTENSTENSGK